MSSPTIKNLSRIEAAFLASDRRYFHVPCHGCGRKQKLEWEFVKWEKDRPDTAVYVCRHCGVAWNDAQRQEAIHSGEWIAEGEFNGTAGFFLWEAYNPWVTLADMATRFLDAHRKSKQGSNEALRAFINTSLARTWEESAETAAPEPLMARRENYGPGSIPWAILYLTAGIDVQDDRLEIEVVGWRASNREEPEESWGIEDLALYRNKEKEAADARKLNAVWDELDEILKREYTTQDGRRLRISAACVDSGGHRTDEVYRFCNRRVGRHVYAIKGADGPGPIWPRRAGQSRKYKGSRVWLIRVDTAKDMLYSSLKVTTPGPGYAHFPIGYELGYFQQLTSEQVRTKFTKGHPIRYWYLPEGVRNEALDRRVYALAALRSRSVPWEVLARSAPGEPPLEGQGDQEMGRPGDKETGRQGDAEQVRQEPPKPRFATRKVRTRYR